MADGEDENDDLDKRGTGLAAAFGGGDEEDSESTSSSQSSQSSRTQRGRSGDGPGRNGLSKIDRENERATMLLHPDTHDQVEDLYDLYARLYRHKHGEKLEKNRHFYEEAMQLVIDHREELAERLDIDDVDPMEAFDFQG